MYYKNAKDAITDHRGPKRNGSIEMISVKVRELNLYFKDKGFYKHGEPNNWSKYIGINKRVHCKYLGNKIEWHIDNH